MGEGRREGRKVEEIMQEREGRGDGRRGREGEVIAQNESVEDDRSEAIV